MEVGMVFAVVAPVGVNERLLVRLTVSDVAPMAFTGTVITTGDQVKVVVVPDVNTDAGLSGAQVAADPVAAVPQK
jgi:hypothetical protein